jgi:type II secretory pathway pseudopilin PulG
MKKNHGFSILETLAVILSFGILFFGTLPIREKITKKQTEAIKGKYTTEIEIAKSKFDQDSSPQEKDAFNNGKEEDRFEKLAPYLKTSTSEVYFSGDGRAIRKLLINTIGTDVQIPE